MKIIIALIFTAMIFTNCQDFRSRKKQNREQYPPQKLFEGIQLQAAQKIFDEDNSGLENTINTNPQIINQLSEKKGYTLLLYATMLENIKGMEVLLQKGADPNIITPDLFNSPVSQAVGTNNYEMLNVLLKYKANLNPAIGVSPLSDAMLLGGEGTERKMIDYLLEHGADINHVSYDGGNIMENAARDDLKLAIYFLEKGGQPKIKGTELCPMARYIQFEEENQRKHNKTENLNEILAFKRQLSEKYNVQFPYKEDPIEVAKLYIRLYENMSEKDKKSLNFNDNYGEKQYKKNKELVDGQK